MDKGQKTSYPSKQTEITPEKLATWKLQIIQSMQAAPHMITWNNIWYQPEEVFPMDGTPEERQHAFWVPVDPLYYNISKKLEVIARLEEA